MESESEKLNSTATDFLHLIDCKCLFQARMGVGSYLFFPKPRTNLHPPVFEVLKEARVEKRGCQISTQE